jgi:hypothetical protein
MVKEVEFPSEGATLRGLLYVPESRPRGAMVAADRFLAADWTVGGQRNGPRSQLRSGRRWLLWYRIPDSQ